MDGLGQRVVVERLLDLDRLAGLDELVYVRRHGTVKDIVGVVQVRTLVIPAAGLGTRFLPVTKAVPKELMPVGDTPAIQLVIDEALAAGIEHVVVVSSATKPSLQRYFEADPALVESLRAKGADGVADRLESIGRDWRVTVVHQDRPLGLGHAVGCAREAVGGEGFVVSLPDEIMGGSALLRQMIDVCVDTSGSVVGLMEIPRDEVSAYGVIDPIGEVDGRGVVAVRDLVEKPPVEAAPSSMIVIGRYVLTPDVFDEIALLTPGAGGELQLTDALRAQASRSPFHGVIAAVDRWDTGTPDGFLAAAVEHAVRADVTGSLGSRLRSAIERAAG
jgi:UTP--glucose-1-phosphate uridylyltransferase